MAAFLVLAFIAFLILAAIRADKPLIENSVSHWHQSIEGLEGTPREFYEEIQKEIRERELPNVEMRIVSWHEGGIHTEKRDYLRITRDGYTFDLCVAPFGGTFFVSAWLGIEKNEFLNAISGFPLVAWLVRLFNPATYYRIDSGLMFQGAVQEVVLEVLDRMTAAQGVDPLQDFQRRPVLSELYGRRGNLLPA